MLTRLRAMSRMGARAVLALALLVLVAGPAMDRVMCAADGLGVHAASAADHQAKAPLGDAPDDEGLCVHGHCHLGSSLLAEAPAPAAALAQVAAAFPPVIDGDHPSIAVFPLERPPQA